jgi:hypothetical protein
MNRYIAIAAAVVVVVVAFIIARSGGGDTATTSTPSRGAGPVRAVLEIRRHQPVGGVHRIVATSGQGVRIVVRTADTNGEVHLHGYDVEKKIAPGKPVVFAFKARLQGGFDIELHPSTKLADLEVRP